MNEINLKDKVIQQRILDRIKNDWSFGIRPSGKLAGSSYLSEYFQPDFSFVKMPEKEKSKVMADTEWTQNLIENSVFDIRDGVTMNSLSVTQSLVQLKKKKTQYLLEYKPIIFIDLSRPEKITDNLNKRLENIENQYAATKDCNDAWKSLCSLFENYGFLWPEGITIGYKQSTLLERSDACETDDKEPNTLDFDEPITEDSIETWKLVKRKNLRPIYEFIPQFKRFILKILKKQMPGLKLNTPVCWDQKFNLKNVHSNHYLTRHEHLKEEYEPSLCENRSDDHCSWSFQKPRVCHRRLSEVLRNSESVFLCSPRYQVPDVEHYVITSEGSETDSHGIHHVHLSMDFHEKSNEWILEAKDLKDQNQRYSNETLDESINNFECLLDGDKIMLRQSEVYLSTNESMFDNIKYALKGEIAPRIREFKEEYMEPIFAPRPKKHRSLQSSKSCILPGKTSNRRCTHSAHHCGSHLLVKKPFLRKHSEYVWKIEIINNKQDHLIYPSDQSDIFIGTGHNSEIHEEPNQLMENNFQTNLIQSNLDLKSQPDSTTAIRSHLDLTSQRLYRASEINYNQDIDSSSSSEESSLVQSIASGPNTSDKGSISFNRPNYGRKRHSLLTEAQAYKVRVEKYFRKKSDSILYSPNHRQSSLGIYINGNDEGIYTQEQLDNEKASIKTQKKRMKLLLGLGKKKLKKNTIVTYLRRATLTSYVPDVSRISIKKSKSNKSTS